MSGFYMRGLKQRQPMASADNAVNWAEGMAPSAVNDSGRGLMASAAKWRDDISGSVATDGTSTAYTVASNQGFDTLAHLDGMMIAFTPHDTNGATVTLSVDGLGAKPLRSAPGVELPAAALIEREPIRRDLLQLCRRIYLAWFPSVAGSDPDRWVYSISRQHSTQQQFCVSLWAAALANRLLKTVRSGRNYAWFRGWINNV